LLAVAESLLREEGVPTLIEGGSLLDLLVAVAEERSAGRPRVLLVADGQRTLALAILASVGLVEAQAVS
jgi:hypothetical protein